MSLNVNEEIERLRAKYGARPPGEAVLEILQRCDNDEQRMEIERAFIRETDNGPRAEDGDQGEAVAPSEDA